MNTLTDSLKIVTREEGKGTFALFRRKRAEQYGFALVVFRKKAMLGYISSSDISVESDIQRRYDRLGVKDGDVILSINLGPQPLKITQTMPTRDNFPRYYEIELDIAVNNPIQFAQRYIQESDPVGWARTAIEGFISYSAGHWDHDDISETMLREWVSQALTIPQNANSGLRVAAVHKAPLQMNRERSAAIDIERRRKLEELQIQKDSYIQRIKKQEEFNIGSMVADEQRKNIEVQTDFQRREELRQVEHENVKTLAELDEQVKREEKAHILQRKLEEQRHALDMFKQGNTREETYVQLLEEGKLLVQQHRIEEAKLKHQLALGSTQFESDMRQRWIARIGEEATPALITRINEQLLNDRSTLGTAASEPELQYLLDILSGGSSNSAPNKLLGMPQNQNTSRVSPVSESTSSKDPQIVNGQFSTVKTLPGVIEQAKETVEIPDLGLRLIQTTMSEEQQQLAGTETSIGYIVYMINRHGPAGQTNLRVSDIVFAIATAEQGDSEQEITSTQDISQAISTHEGGSELTFIVLRDLRVERITVKTAR